MATVRYTVLDGEILAEKRGGVRRSYVPDPLGSTVALLDNTQAQTDTFAYFPYGEQQSRTGTTETPFRFGGTLGYYRDTDRWTYVRARYYRPDHGRWHTQDPLPPFLSGLNKYRYALNRPTSQVDPSGLKCKDEFYPCLGLALVGGATGCLGGLNAWCKACIFSAFTACLGSGPGYVACVGAAMQGCIAFGCAAQCLKGLVFAIVPAIGLCVKLHCPPPVLSPYEEGFPDRYPGQCPYCDPEDPQKKCPRPHR